MATMQEQEISDKLNKLTDCATQGPPNEELEKEPKKDMFDESLSGKSKSELSLQEGLSFTHEELGPDQLQPQKSDSHSKLRTPQENSRSPSPHGTPISPAQADPNRGAPKDSGVFSNYYEDINFAGMLIGIGAMADSLDPISRLPRDSSNNPAATEAATLRNTFIEEGASRRAKNLTYTAAIFLCKNPTLIEAGMTRDFDESVRNTGPDPSFEYKDYLADMFTVVYATKVQWWKTGNHTNTNKRKATGYLAKKMRSVGLVVYSAADIKVVHAIGHWFNTKAILAKAQVPGVPRPPNIDDASWDELPPVSRDARVRLFSNPAGTAKQCGVVAVLKVLHASDYMEVVYSTAKNNMMRLFEWERNASKNWPAYHMNAQYLLGRPRIEPIEVDMKLGGIAKAFCCSVLKNSTIARSPALSTFLLDEEFLCSISRAQRKMGKKQIDPKKLSSLDGLS